MLTESVRLTDDVNLREQTDEDGDVFHWWMHQAKRGVLAAQVKILILNLLNHIPYSYPTKNPDWFDKCKVIHCHTSGCCPPYRKVDK